MKEKTQMPHVNEVGSLRRLVQRMRYVLVLPFFVLAEACGGGGGGDGAGTAADPGTQAPQPAGIPLPNDLAGVWNTTLTYVPAYYTGIVPNQDFLGSIGIALRLYLDGSYQFDLRSASNYFNGLCFRSTHWSETGKVSVANAAITFTSLHATDMVLDSCGANRYVDPAATATATYPLAREQDAAGWPRLRLQMPGGEDLVLERCRDCG